MINTFTRSNTISMKIEKDLEMTVCIERFISPSKIQTAAMAQWGRALALQAEGWGCDYQRFF